MLARLAEVGLPESSCTKNRPSSPAACAKRVGLARALAMDPEVMLYDEPTTGLDPIMSDVINELILRTRARYPVTSIVVTHDMHTARKVADRIVMFYPLAAAQGGRAADHISGTPAEIDAASDPRVTQFVEGEAGERLMEMRKIA